MEEIEALKVRALDDYLGIAKYTQVEDLLTAVAVNISTSTARILEDIFDVRGTTKSLNIDEVSEDLHNIICHIAVMAHCLDVDIPELEEIMGFVEEEISYENRMDSSLAVLTIQNISSHMTLEYFSNKFEEEDLVEADLVQVGIIDMLANVYVICEKQGLDFEQIIIFG